MPVTISGDGGIAGISSLGGGDFVAGSLAASGELIAGPQALGRATLYVDSVNNCLSVNTLDAPPAGVFLQVKDGIDPIVSLNNTAANGDLTLGCVAGGAYIGPESNNSLTLQTSGTTRVLITNEGLVGVSTISPDPDFTSTINAGDNPDALLLEQTAGGPGAGVRLGFRNSDSQNWTVFNNGDANLLFETDQGAFSANPKLFLRPSGRHIINRGSTAQSFSALEIFQETTSMANDFRAALALWSNTYTGEDSGTGVDLGGVVTDSGPYRTFGGIKGVKENATDNDTAGRLEFWTRATSGTYSRKASFTSTGNLAFYAAGNGLDFSNTATVNATSNILDDYEQGTFTPSFGIGSAVATYDTQTGDYIKVGKKVTIQVILISNSITGTLDSNILTLEGLPFTIANTFSVLPWIAKWTSASFSGSTGYSIGLRGVFNTNTMRFYYQNASSGVTIPRSELATTNNKNQVEFVLSYFTD